MSRMKFSVTLLAAITALMLVTTNAYAQYQFIGPGSTAPGDYLRGVGIEASGLGSYNLNTAQANSINTDTSIRWDSYLSSILQFQKEEYATRVREVATTRINNYNKARQSVLENPTDFDVRNSRALNRIRDELVLPIYTPSMYRYAEVPIPVSLIRKIPFQLGEKGVTFSMARLSPSDAKKWVVAFQDDRCMVERRKYEEAIEVALGQAIEGKILDGSIEKVEEAVVGLENRLNDGVIPKTDTRYTEGQGQLRELRGNAQQLKLKQVEAAIGEIDKYSGLNMFDLKTLMQRHNLRFGEAKTPDEKEVYPEIYTLLRVQQLRLGDPAKAPVK
jgi:hypothetical protein